MTDLKIKRFFWSIGNFYRCRLQILANLSGKDFGWNGIYGALLVSQRRARSEISIHGRSLEIFNPEGRDRILFNLRALWVGRTPKGSYSPRGRSRHLLETPFSEPLLRTLLRTLLYCKTHRKRPPSQNPSENPSPRTLPRTFSEPFLERCVAVRPLRRAPKKRPFAGYF